MKLYGMTNQLQQLREVEVRFQRDMSEQAATVLNLRLATINESAVPEAQKERERTKAISVYTFTMGREPVFLDVPF